MPARTAAALMIATMWLRGAESAAEHTDRLPPEKRCEQAERALQPLSLATAPLHYAVAECYFKVYRWQKALPFLEDYLRLVPQDSSAVFRLAFAQFKTGRYSESLDHIKAYLGKESGNAEAHKVLSMDLIMLGKPAEAEAAMKRATELAPQDPEAIYGLGRLYFTRQDMRSALETFRRAAELEPASVKIHNHIGQAYEGLGMLTEARHSYLQAIELEKPQTQKSEWPYYNLGLLSLREGRNEEAVAWLRRALAIKPSWTDCLVKLASALLAAGHVDAARLQLTEVMRNHPEHAEAHYQFGRLLVRMGQPGQAAEHFLLFERLKKL